MSIYRQHSLIIKIITELSTIGNLNSRQRCSKLEMCGQVMHLYYLSSVIHPLKFFVCLFLLFLREYVNMALGSLL